MSKFIFMHLKSKTFSMIIYPTDLSMITFKYLIFIHSMLKR